MRAQIFAHACHLGLEGIVSKHADDPIRATPAVMAQAEEPNPSSIVRVREAFEAERRRGLAMAGPSKSSPATRCH